MGHTRNPIHGANYRLFIWGGHHGTVETSHPDPGPVSWDQTPTNPVAIGASPVQIKAHETAHTTMTNVSWFVHITGPATLVHAAGKTYTPVAGSTQIVNNAKSTWNAGQAIALDEMLVLTPPAGGTVTVECHVACDQYDSAYSATYTFNVTAA